MPRASSKINITPSMGWILIEELDSQTSASLTSGTSLQVAGDEHSQLTISKVLQIGTPKITDHGAIIDTDACPGDLIAYPSLAADKLRVDGKQYLLIPFEQVKAIIKE